LLGVVDKIQFSTAWAGFYARGLGYKDAYVRQGSTFTLTWLVTDTQGQPLINQSVTLQANKGYGGATGTFIIGSVIVPNNTGTNDGARIPGVTNSQGLVSFTITDTSVSAEPYSTSVTEFDPLSEANGAIYGQFGLQIGTTPQISQSMDIIDLHILSNDSTPPPPIPSSLNIGALLWSDEFTGAAGAQANSTVWTPRYCGQAATNGGGTCHNNEQQYYIPEAIAQDGSAEGKLVITTQRITKAPANGGVCYVGKCSFTSGRLDTQGKVSFQYGYIEARIKMPAGSGNWPAFWALGTNISSVGWPVSGEIDIAEAGGDQPNRATSAAHYSTTFSGCCDNHLYDAGSFVSPTSYADGYHLYALAWTQDKLTFLVDGKSFFEVTKSSIQSQYWPFNAPVFLILNNAVGSFGGSWDNLNSSTMSIDWVRVYELNGQGKVFNK
jgi:beta-glucanase (GH16 family)